METAQLLSLSLVGRKESVIHWEGFLRLSMQGVHDEQGDVSKEGRLALEEKHLNCE